MIAEDNLSMWCISKRRCGFMLLALALASFIASALARRDHVTEANRHKIKSGMTEKEAMNTLRSVA